MYKICITALLSLVIGLGSGLFISDRIKSAELVKVKSAYESKIASLSTKAKTSKSKVTTPDGTVTETEETVTTTESKVKESNRPKWTAGIGYTTEQEVEISLHRDLIYGLGMRLDYIPQSNEGSFNLTFSY